MNLEELGKLSITVDSETALVIADKLITYKYVSMFAALLIAVVMIVVFAAIIRKIGPL